MARTIPQLAAGIVCCLAQLACGSIDEPPQDRQSREQFAASLLRSFRSRVSLHWSIAISSDGARLASATGDGFLQLWDVSSGDRLREVSAHSGGAFSIAFSPDSKRLASGGRDPFIRFWDVENGKEISPPLRHGNLAITALAFNSEGTLLASGSTNGTIQVWDVSQGKETAKLFEFSDYVTSIAFDPKSEFLASGSYDQKGILWDLAAAAKVRAVKGAKGRMEVKFTSDGDCYCAAVEHGQVGMWNLSRGERLPVTAMPDSQAAMTLAWAPNYLIGGGEKGAVWIWSSQNGKLVRTLDSQGEAITAVTYGSGSRLLAAASPGEVMVWRIE